MKIIPLVGFDNVTFRMKPLHAQKILGEPTEVEKLEDEEDYEIPTIIWHYGDIKLSVFFEREPSELTSFECSNPDAELAGNKIFTLTKQKVILLMKELGFTKMEESEEPWGETRVSFDDALVDFYFEKGRLTSVNWGVLPG